MLARLLQIIFVPRSTRRRLARAPGQAPGRRPVKPPAAPANRTAVLDDAMAVYRQKRELYESLDEETRSQIDADAAKLFGDAVKARR